MASPIRCIIVDDDPSSRALIESYVEQHAGLEAVGVYEDAVEAANALQQHQVDVMLLDIEMPNMSGLELVDTLNDPPAVIVITGHERYAVNAFELAVTDYLVKPVQYARFMKAVERVRTDLTAEPSRTATSTDSSSQAAAPSPEAASDAAPNHVFLKDGRRLIRVALSAIQWIEAQGDYMLVRAGSERYMINSTMKQLEEKLPPDQFVRIHRSHIVRIDQIDDIEDGTLVVGGRMLPIGPSYEARLRSRIDTL